MKVTLDDLVRLGALDAGDDVTDLAGLQGLARLRLGREAAHLGNRVGAPGRPDADLRHRR